MMSPSRRGLVAWSLLLWGPLAWTLHFTLVYAAANLEATYRPTAGVASRVAIGLATLVTLVLVLGGWWKARTFSPGQPGSDLERFWTSSTRILCLISAVAIVYQALPALLVP